MPLKALPHWTPDALAATLGALDVGDVRANEPMSEHTTFKVGGPADAFVAVRDRDALARLLRYLRTDRVPWMVLGNGSNLLIHDGGISGVVVSLKHLDQIEVLDADSGRVRADGGVPLTRLVRLGLDQGFGGVWFLGGIPGTVGGAVRMNAGTRYGAIDQVIESVRVISGAGTFRELAKDSIEFSYRSSTIPRDRIVLDSTFVFGREEVETLREKHREVMQYRTTTQPLQLPSAGSVFRNPPAKPNGEPQAAGRLIEACGLKGVRVQGAQISEKHANWIVNVGNATAGDILTLIRLIRDKVKEEHQVQLDLEVRVLGRALEEVPAGREGGSPL